jgi:hypothetical protein
VVYLKRTKAKPGSSPKDEEGSKEGAESKRMAQKYISSWRNGAFRAEVAKWGSEPVYVQLSKWWVNANGTPGSARIRIKSEDQWMKIKRAIDVDFARHLGWAGFQTPEVEDGKSISVEEHEAAVKRLEKRNKKLLTETMEMEKNIVRLRQNIRRKQEERYRTKIPEHKRILAEFRKMIDADVSEQRMHPFLKENYWIFGAHYVGRTNKPQIGFRNFGDFMLEKVDGYYNIVELKSPRDAVFTKQGKLSGVAKDAISQMITYLHKCDITYTHHLSEFGMDILKPHGFIIIGRRDTVETAPDSKSSVKRRRKSTTVENLQIHNAFLKNMTLMTFDQLYETAKQTIRGFEGDSKP